MTPEQVIEVLAYASSSDLRLKQRTDDDLAGQLAAWVHELAQVDRGFAMDYVSRYYGTELRQYSIIPQQIRAGWERDQDQRRASELAHASREVSRHCKQVGCPCTHNDPCFGGWITVEEPYPFKWKDTAPGKVPMHDVAYRCPTCGDTLNRRLVTKGEDPLSFPPPPDHVWHQPPEDNDPADMDPDLLDGLVAGLRDAFKRSKRP